MIFFNALATWAVRSERAPRRRPFSRGSLRSSREARRSLRGRHVHEHLVVDRGRRGAKRGHARRAEGFADAASLIGRDAHAGKRELHRRAVAREERVRRQASAHVGGGMARDHCPFDRQKRANDRRAAGLVRRLRARDERGLRSVASDVGLSAVDGDARVELTELAASANDGRAEGARGGPRVHRAAVAAIDGARGGGYERETGRREG